MFNIDFTKIHCLQNASFLKRKKHSKTHQQKSSQKVGRWLNLGGVLEFTFPRVFFKMGPWASKMSPWAPKVTKYHDSELQSDQKSCF